MLNRKDNNQIDIMMTLRLNLGKSTISDFNSILFTEMLCKLDLIEDCQIGLINDVK